VVRTFCWNDFRLFYWVVCSSVVIIFRFAFLKTLFGCPRLLSRCCCCVVLKPTMAPSGVGRKKTKKAGSGSTPVRATGRSTRLHPLGNDVDIANARLSLRSTSEVSSSALVHPFRRYLEYAVAAW